MSVPALYTHDITRFGKSAPDDAAHVLDKARALAQPMLQSLNADAHLPDLRARMRDFAKGATDIMFIGMGGPVACARIFAPLAQKHPRIHFIDTPDPARLEAVLASCAPERTRVFALSKSGATPETLGILDAALAWLGTTAASSVIAASVRGRSPLRTRAEDEGFFVLDMPDAIDGRFGVFTPANDAALCLMGVDPAEVRAGAVGVDAGDAATGAARIAALARPLHVLMPSASALMPLALWWRQIWAESLARGGEGATPIIARGDTDQHSQFQLYLDGPRDKVFTYLDAPAPKTIAHSESLHALHRAQTPAGTDALADAGLPVRIIRMARLDAAALGAVAMHFIWETLTRAALAGISPFGQPGVARVKRALHARILRESDTRQEGWARKA